MCSFFVLKVCFNNTLSIHRWDSGKTFIIKCAWSFTMGAQASRMSFRAWRSLPPSKIIDPKRRWRERYVSTLCGGLGIEKRKEGKRSAELQEKWRLSDDTKSDTVYNKQCKGISRALQTRTFTWRKSRAETLHRLSRQPLQTTFMAYHRRLRNVTQRSCQPIPFSSYYIVSLV